MHRDLHYVFLLSNSVWENIKAYNNLKLQPLYQTCIYYVLEIYLMVAESEPVREPTNHRCEECDKIFPTAEELTTHYTKDHHESS